MPKLRILLVDDNPEVRHSLATLLQEYGHQIDEADDGRAAQEILAVSSYDLVITDFQMPRMNGLELINAAQQAGNPPPFILCSGDSVAIRAARAAGHAAFDKVADGIEAILDYIQTLPPPPAYHQL